MEYDEEDFTTLINYKTFSQHIRGFIIEQNPNIPMSRCVQLVGAKWREFQSLNPYNKEKTPKRTKTAAAAVAPETPLMDAGETVEEITPQSLAKGKSKRARAGKKAVALGDEEKTVAPLKIKISNKKKKKKKNSSVSVCFENFYFIFPDWL